MSAKTTTTESDGFSPEERAAMKERATELRAEGKKGAKRADGLQAVLDRIAQMEPDDRALAERVHVTVTAAAPDLSPKTWYGMPAYANADGKIVVFFQDSGKFNYRYSTLGFQDPANLDDGDLWPVAYALQQWSPRWRRRSPSWCGLRSPDPRSRSAVPAGAAPAQVVGDGCRAECGAPEHPGHAGQTQAPALADRGIPEHHQAGRDQDDGDE
ncbi:hypothetical protein NKG94_21460 [Micromonospora sp. M12]